jgi:hypothetical protein
VKTFFRILCSPVTRPVSRFATAGSSQVRLLLLSIALVGGIWVATIVLYDVVAGA